MTIHNLVSFAGIFLLIGTAWLLSPAKRVINWHVVTWGVGLQLVFALFIFVVPAGTQVFLAVNSAVVRILDSASTGARFVFGTLALPPGVEGSPGFILATQAFPTIIFFSALIAILYYYGIMPRVIGFFANMFTRLVKVSGAESLCAASNIFVGVESAFTVRPYIAEMTRSELCTVLTAGMATVASNVLALYVFMLQRQFPTIAGHLISASLLSAPAALVMSKVILPEEHRPKTLGRKTSLSYEREGNIFETVIISAQSGVKVIVGIAALLVAVLGLVALLDLILGGVGARLNSVIGLNLEWSFKGVLGYLFYPFTLVLGVPVSDAAAVARIIGQRLVLTEVASYQELAGVMASGALKHPRSAVIATYALCGFAHVASMAIFVGGLCALCPARSRVVTEVALRALIAATLACLMTACVAGTFFSGNSILLGF